MCYIPFAHLSATHDSVAASQFTDLCAIIGVPLPSLDVTSLASIITTLRSQRLIKFSAIYSCEQVEVSNNGITIIYRIPNPAIPEQVAMITISSNPQAPGFKHLTNEFDRLSEVIPDEFILKVAA